MAIDPVPIPIQEAVRDFFVELLGRGVAATKRPPRPVGGDTLLVGRYDDDGGEPAALLVADVPFAAFSGAALAMIPPVIAAEAVDQGAVSGNLLDNFREVVNVFSGLLNTASTPHLTLGTLGQHRDVTSLDVSSKVGALLEAPARRRDFDVTIEGYGDGYLAVLVAA